MHNAHTHMHTRDQENIPEEEARRRDRRYMKRQIEVFLAIMCMWSECCPLDSNFNLYRSWEVYKKHCKYKAKGIIHTEKKVVMIKGKKVRKKN